MEKRHNYEDLGDYPMPPELTSRVEEAIGEADRYVASLQAGNHEVRVNFRWSARQLELVQQAADLMGVPYQSYLKQAALRQALTDLKAASDLRDRRPIENQPRSTRMTKTSG